jgi:hypothetical protein
MAKSKDREVVSKYTFWTGFVGCKTHLVVLMPLQRNTQGGS